MKLKRIFKKYKPLFINDCFGYLQSKSYSEALENTEIECGNCEEYIDEDDNFCKSCGCKINWEMSDEY